MDQDEFEAWIWNKPKIWAVAIANRVDLRSFPLLVPPPQEQNSDPPIDHLVLLNGLAQEWISLVVDRSELRSNYNRRLVSYQETVAFFAADCVRSVRDISSENRTYFHVIDEFWRQIEFEIRLLSSLTEAPNETASRLVRLPLWNEPPNPVFVRWNDVKAELLRTVAKEEARGMGSHLDEAERRRLKELEAEDWGVWTDWYDRRLRGDPPNEALEIERVTSPHIPWEKGPRAANRALREIENEHAHKPPGAEFVKPQALRLAAMPALAETTAEGLARQIEDWISACLRESEANALPDELIALEALPAILRRMSKAVHAEGGTEALEATIAAMAVEIARLKADVALAKNAPRESVFWSSFSKRGGERLAETLFDVRFWGAFAGCGYLLLGDKIGAAALSEFIATIRAPAP